MKTVLWILTGVALVAWVVGAIITHSMAWTIGLGISYVAVFLPAVFYDAIAERLNFTPVRCAFCNAPAVISRRPRTCCREGREHDLKISLLQP